MIETVGIIGSGKMGSDIFNYLSDYNYKLKWYILFEEEKEKLHKHFHKKINRQLKHNLITEEEFNFKSNFSFTADLLELSDCDLIIESIPEEIEIKKNIFLKLNYLTNKHCIFVSNSSSILPSKLSTNRNVTGMHFFYPVAFKNTVELIFHKDVDIAVRKKLKDFLESVQKNVFVQDESSSFLLNRFLLDIQVKAYDLAKSHEIDYLHFDKVLGDVISDFGLFEMIDEVGLETMYNAISNYAQMDSSPNRFNNLLSDLKDKIINDIPFCNVNNESELDEKLVNYLKNDIKYFMLTLIKDYCERFKIEESLFKSYISDFLGIKFKN